MKSNIKLLITVCYCVSMNAQVSSYTLQGRSQLNGLENVLEIKQQNRWNPIDFIGSPYLYNSFMLGSIYLEDELIAKEILLRYDIHKEQLEIKVNSDQNTIKFIESKPGIAFEIQGALYEYVSPSQNTSGGFFEPIFKSTSLTIYKKPLKLFREGQEATTSMTRDILPTYKDRFSYFYRKTNETLEELNLSKRNVLALFSDHQKELQAFVKKEKLKLKSDEELLKLFTHYKSLL